MKAIDTNILVRLLLNDDVEQIEKDNNYKDSISYN